MVEGRRHRERQPWHYSSRRRRVLVSPPSWRLLARSSISGPSKRSSGLLQDVVHRLVQVLHRSGRLPPHQHIHDQRSQDLARGGALRQLDQKRGAPVEPLRRLLQPPSDVPAEPTGRCTRPSPPPAALQPIKAYDVYSLHSYRAHSTCLTSQKRPMKC